MAQGGAVKHKKKTKSVLKNIRQAEQRQAVNQMNRTRVRSAIRRLRRLSARRRRCGGEAHLADIFGAR